MSLPRARLIATLLWPAFVVAFLGTGAVYALVDPEPLLECAAAWWLLRLDPLGLYTVTFGYLWLTGALASLGATYLLRVADPQRAEQE